MARTPAGLPAGIRLSDHISLGVIARTFPPDRVREVLVETGRADSEALIARCDHLCPLSTARAPSLYMSD